ncbi:MAG: hypothetical protein K8Q91_00810 [Candidatus Vogelbacteria bacterium]|nr:hypothetical protein [Candidatus Vogelbacteria bacterium]
MKKYLVVLLMVTVLVPGQIFAVTSATVTVDTIVSDSSVNEQGVDVGFWGGLFDRLKSFVTGFGLFKNTQPVVEEKQTENSGDVVKDPSGQDTKTANKVVVKTDGNMSPNGRPSTVSFKTNVTNQVVGSGQIKTEVVIPKVESVVSVKPFAKKINLTSPTSGSSFNATEDPMTISWNYSGIKDETTINISLVFGSNTDDGVTLCRVTPVEGIRISAKEFTIKSNGYNCFPNNDGGDPLKTSGEYRIAFISEDFAGQYDRGIIYGSGTFKINVAN